jgi:hypothetical protein
MKLTHVYEIYVQYAEAELGRRERSREQAQRELDAVPEAPEPLPGSVGSAELLAEAARWEAWNARRRAAAREQVRAWAAAVDEAGRAVKAARRRLEMVERIAHRKEHVLRRTMAARRALRLEDDWRARRR